MMSKVSAFGLVSELPQDIQDFLNAKGLNPGENTEIVAWYYKNEDGTPSNHGGFCLIEYSDDEDIKAMLDVRNKLFETE